MRALSNCIYVLVMYLYEIKRVNIVNLEGWMITKSAAIRLTHTNHMQPYKVILLLPKYQRQVAVV